METTTSSTEAARHLGDVLARVKHAGETFIVTKSDKPLARLMPIRGINGGRGCDIMDALAKLPHDPDFADDLEKVNQQNITPIFSPNSQKRVSLFRKTTLRLRPRP